MVCADGLVVARRSEVVLRVPVARGHACCERNRERG
jgi:hypothetical protein